MTRFQLGASLREGELFIPPVVMVALTMAIVVLRGQMLMNKPIYVALAQRREVRRTQLEAQFAQRTGMPPRGLPLAQGMYGLPYWVGAPSGMPQQPRSDVVAHLLSS